MIQPIVHDPLFLAQKSAPATPADADTARDLLETLTAHADGCVGMAGADFWAKNRGSPFLFGILSLFLALLFPISSE